jgi:phospholipase A1
MRSDLTGRVLQSSRRHRGAAAAQLRLRVGAAALALGAPCAGAQAVADCVGEADSARRLACYDQLFRGAGASLPASPAAPPSPSPVPPLAAAPPDDRPESLLISTLFTKAWELTPATKRGTFVVRTYLPNFVLPAHYTSSINRAPSSPTHAAGAEANYRPIEAKLQVSLRAKVVEGLVLPNADLWFAFTQRSLWQVWNRQESSPFRSTDYQPEAIYVIPTSPRLGTLPGGWQWRMTQLGIAHQSNGQSDPLSRSWNRVYAGAAFDRGEFGLTVRAHHRLKESKRDDNPDLTNYIGNTEVQASWLPGLSTASLTWRTHFRSAGRGSLQLDWSYPVNRAQPAGLRWYAQLFTGYGETLLDYNHRQTSLGLGVTLFQF